MTQLDKNLSEVFDVAPLSETPKTDVVVADTDVTPVTQIENVQEVVNPQEVHDQTQARTDHETVRSNMLDLIDKSKIALEAALDVVNQTDAPRAFEVFATLITAMGKLNLDLNELHTKKQELKNKRGEQDTPSKVVNNNAIFVGSTADLNKMLSKMTKDSK